MEKECILAHNSFIIRTLVYGHNCFLSDFRYIKVTDFSSIHVLVNFRYTLLT
jgi:hypothetical protein